MKSTVHFFSDKLFAILVLCVPVYSHEASKTWRIVPLISVKLQKQLKMSALERGINSLFTLNFDKVAGMPLYEKGAPRRIFIFDVTQDNGIIFTRVDFDHKGYFCGPPPHDVITLFEGEHHLQDLIRTTTGINNPCGFVRRHESEFERGVTVGISYVISSYNFFVDSLCLMLQASATFQYRPSHCVGIRRAAHRPSIFISSCVTDEMLLQEFEKITWETIEKYLKEYLSKSDKDVMQLRKAYDQFHYELHRMRSTPRVYNDVLCIV